MLSSIESIIDIVITIVCLLFIIFIFKKKDKKNSIIKISIESLLVVLELIDLYLEVKLGESYIMSIIIIFLWLFNLTSELVELFIKKELNMTKDEIMKIGMKDLKDKLKKDKNNEADKDNKDDNDN